MDEYIVLVELGTSSHPAAVLPHADQLQWALLQIMAFTRTYHAGYFRLSRRLSEALTRDFWVESIEIEKSCKQTALPWVPPSTHISSKWPR